MTNQNGNDTTEQLPSSLEARVSALEVGFAAQQRMLSEMNGKLDLLIKMQQEMYVDLRGRFVALNNNLVAIANTIHQIQEDIQPDSFQHRLMRMGQ